MSLASTCSLTPLACPACGGSLDPLPADLVFVCSSCGAGSEIQRLGELPRAVNYAGSGRIDPSLLYLPFWSFGKICIAPAFNGTRLLTLTTWYSKRADPLTRSPGRPRSLWGGSIGSLDARRICALSVDRAGERAVRSPPPPSDAPSLLALPFRAESSRLVCALTGLHVYLETIEGADAILGRWEKLLQSG